MLIAALRLSIHYSRCYGTSYIILTRAFWFFLFLHGGIAALLFLPLRLRPGDWPSVSPWLFAVVAPLLVNQLLKLRPLDFPETTGPLSRFRDQFRKDFEQRMIDQEFTVIRNVVGPYAKGRSLFEVRALALQNIPLQLPARKAAAFRNSLLDAKTVEDVLELFIRHVGKESFQFVFGRESTETTALASLPLFDELNRQAA